MDFQLNIFVTAALVALPHAAMAADPLPPELHGAADMRGQIEALMQSATPGLGTRGWLEPGATPEQEMARRRQLINGAHRDFVGIVGAQRAPVGIEGEQSAHGSPRRADGLLADPGTPDEGASARAPREGFDAESASSMRETIGPPRAIAIEGRITIQGGEGQASAQTKGSKNLRYIVEERFVGNLLIAEPFDLLVTKPTGDIDEGGIASARGGQPEASSSGRRADRVPLSEIGQPAGGKPSHQLSPGDAIGVASATGPGGGQTIRREYELDTLSAGIEVKSVQGGVCLERSGQDGACARSVPFSQFDVSSANRYGQFKDGVVSVGVEDGKVRIEVEAPDVAFATSGGEVKASLNCSRARFDLSENDFRRLLERGELTLSTPVGNSGKHAVCAEGSSITVNLRVRGD